MTTNNGPLELHPNSRPIKYGLKRPKRADEVFLEDVFPDTSVGKLLKGLVLEFLIKQEHRMGWARKSACDDNVLCPYPNESVAAHQWGVANLVMVLTKEPKFQEELPGFDTLKAIEMALIHDVPELITGDITPVDGISQEEKHKMESDAMNLILGCFPDAVKQSLHKIYRFYEDRKCVESKFVKDCDRLDFMIHAFLLERQGFVGFEEFYDNSKKGGFSTKIVTQLVETLVTARDNLQKTNTLFNI